MANHDLILAGRNTNVPEDVDTHIQLFLGHFTSIASGLVIVSGQHPSVVEESCVSNFPFAEWGWGDYPQCKMGGSVAVGHDVWIGQDVTILEGVSVGHGAILGAGAVVVKDVAPYDIVAGNPARVVGARCTKWDVAPLLRIAWWDWDDDLIKERLPDMHNIVRFIAKYDKFST